MSVTRRAFAQRAAGGALSMQALAAQTPRSANDRIQIATIGLGGMGSGDTQNATSIPGVKLVAVADIYDGRLQRAKEVYGGELFTTRDYREILARRDIDAVIVATPDHWHARISIDAMNAGKDVYCQKPMVQLVEEGPGMIEAQNRTGRLLQVGSQYVSSLVFLKARKLLKAGAIGRLNMVEAWLDRNSAIGAWQYSIPPDASPATVDWDRFLGRAPKRPFEAIRLFRWRNYQDYGTGVAGDLFVHLLSGIHLVTGSLGPDRAYASGGLRHWKDGRDVPDLMAAVLEYPETSAHPDFTLTLKVNFESGGSGESFGVRFIGAEGTLTATMNNLILSKAPRETEPGYRVSTFPKAVQEQFIREYRKKYPERPVSVDNVEAEQVEKFVVTQNSHRDHHLNFWSSVRSRKPVVEDAVFGFRAAGPSLLCNTSYFERRICRWDPEKMAEVRG